MFVVMDTFNFPLHVPQLCTDEDGDTRVFGTYQEAHEFGKEYCQSYQVVLVGDPEVYIAVEYGRVQGILGNTVVKARVFDFDCPPFMREVYEQDFIKKEVEWEILRKNSIPIL